MMDLLIYSLLFPGVAFSFALAFWFEYVERKLTAHIQQRIGPYFTGFKGLLQPIADFAKLLLKEEIVPVTSDRLVFVLAPLISLSIPIFGMCFVPMASTRSPLGFSGDVYLIIFLLVAEAFVTVLMGIAALTPYTLIGVGRHILQYTMYEGVFLLAIASVAIQTRSLGLDDIVEYQMVNGPMILYQPLGFAIAIISLLAKLEKRPFDLPHAKQEIVAGWMTEFSGASLAFVRLFSYLSMVWSISLIADLYLGGPTGYGFTGDYSLIGFAYFLIKINLLLVLVTVISASSGRIRVVGLARRFWGLIYPLAILQFILASMVRFGP